MNFFEDTAEVSFAGIDRIFNVSSVFCEFTVGGQLVSIKWYGVIIAFGFLLAALFGGRIAYKWKMDLNKMIDVLIYGSIGGIIGARLYYCIFSWDHYKDNLLDIFKVWEGGLAIYGGIIGGILAAFITCKVNKLNFYNLLDAAGMSLLIGQGIGRWGNYANQEAFGANTNGKFGMWSEKTAAYIIAHQSELPTVDPALPVHPTFFYEFVWCMLGLGLLYLMTVKFRKFSGQTFLGYGIWYGLGRMIIEGLRTDSLYITGTSIRVSQLLSAIIVAVCTVIMVIMLVKTKKNPKAVEGVDYFIEPKPFFDFEKKKQGKSQAEKQEENNDVHKN